jgi:hypothetical protein
MRLASTEVRTTTSTPAKTGSSGQFANHAAFGRLMATLMEPVSRGIRARAAEVVKQRRETNPGSVYDHLDDAT